MLVLPKRSRGRQSAEKKAAYEADLDKFCSDITELRTKIGFAPSVRGWCYILEEHGLGKGEFEDAENVIKRCRRNGLLPIDIVCEDEARTFEGVERLDNPNIEEEAASWVDTLKSAHNHYRPFSFWRDQKYYIQMMVEKIDLKTLFEPVCRRFNIPIANTRGWPDLHQQVHAMRRFWEAENRDNKKCVLLYCGDHDPVGLSISSTLRKSFARLKRQIWWDPKDLIIDRFGLNANFIDEQGLSWIDGLETGSGRDLGDEDHAHHDRRDIQDYIRRFGKRKCEANALVVRPEAARQLCRDAILRYLPADAPERYRAALKEPRLELQFAIREAARKYGMQRRRLGDRGEE